MREIDYYFVQQCTVSNGTKTFKCDTEDDATWLCNILNYRGTDAERLAFWNKLERQNKEDRDHQRALEIANAGRARNFWVE